MSVTAIAQNSISVNSTVLPYLVRFTDLSNYTFDSQVRLSQTGSICLDATTVTSGNVLPKSGVMFNLEFDANDKSLILPSSQPGRLIILNFANTESAKGDEVITVQTEDKALVGSKLSFSININNVTQLINTGTNWIVLSQQVQS